MVYIAVCGYPGLSLMRNEKPLGAWPYCHEFLFIEHPNTLLVASHFFFSVHLQVRYHESILWMKKKWGLKELHGLAKGIQLISDCAKAQIQVCPNPELFVIPFSSGDW